MQSPSETREDEFPAYVALLNAYPLWNDRVGLSAVRAATAANLPEVRDAASSPL